jgi:hypothetical protein
MDTATAAAGVSQGPSSHLSWDELACHDLSRTPYPFVWRQDRAVELADAFETIRAACGHVPLRVLSGYRTPEHNRRVGGARASQHVEGRALDLAPPKGWSVARFWGVIRGLTEETWVNGLGRYPTFVHVDVRKSPRLVVWDGRRPAADLEA